MEQNKVEFIGKINHKDIKEYTNCTVLRLLVGKKIREDEYASFPITMFNDAAKKTYTKIQKGDYAYFTGKLSMNIYVKDEKQKSDMEFIAFDAIPVKYDTDKKEYVKISEEDKEDKPW